MPFRRSRLSMANLVVIMSRSSFSRFTWVSRGNELNKSKDSIATQLILYKREAHFGFDANNLQALRMNPPHFAVGSHILGRRHPFLLPLHRWLQQRVLGTPLHTGCRKTGSSCRLALRDMVTNLRRWLEVYSSQLALLEQWWTPRCFPLFLFPWDVLHDGAGGWCRWFITSDGRKQCTRRPGNFDSSAIKDSQKFDNTCGLFEAESTWQ